MVWTHRQGVNVNVGIGISIRVERRHTDAWDLVILENFEVSQVDGVSVTH